MYGEEGTARIVYRDRHITNIPSPRISQTTPPPSYHCHRGEETERRHFFCPLLSLSLSCGNLLQYISPPPFSCPHHHFFLASGGKATLSTAGVSPTNRPPSLPLFPRDRSPPPSPRFVSFDVILHCPTLRPLLFRPPPHQQSHSLGICPKVK